MSQAIITRRSSPGGFEPIQATGGTVNDIQINGKNYRTHTFSNPGSNTFSVQNIGLNGNIDILVVAGGGAGGGTQNNRSSAGYGGEVRLTSAKVQNTNYTVNVGAGAIGQNQFTSASAGQLSSFVGTGVNISAQGGAGGLANRCCPAVDIQGQPGYTLNVGVPINFPNPNSSFTYALRGDPATTSVNCNRITPRANSGDGGSAVWCGGSVSGGNGGNGVVIIRYRLEA